MNNRKTKIEKHSSPTLATLGSKTLLNPRSSKLNKRLGGSVLSQAGTHPKLLSSKFPKKRPILFLSDFC